MSEVIHYEELVDPKSSENNKDIGSAEYSESQTHPDNLVRASKFLFEDHKRADLHFYNGLLMKAMSSDVFHEKYPQNEESYKNLTKSTINYIFNDIEFIEKLDIEEPEKLDYNERLSVLVEKNAIMSIVRDPYIDTLPVIHINPKYYPDNTGAMIVSSGDVGYINGRPMNTGILMPYTPESNTEEILQQEKDLKHEIVHAITKIAIESFAVDEKDPNSAHLKMFIEEFLCYGANLDSNYFRNHKEILYNMFYADESNKELTQLSEIYFVFFNNIRGLKDKTIEVGMRKYLMKKCATISDLDPHNPENKDSMMSFTGLSEDDFNKYFGKGVLKDSPLDNSSLPLAA